MQLIADIRFPNEQDSSILWFWARPVRKPATKESPAPQASTGIMASVGMLLILDRSNIVTPFRPLVIMMTSREGERLNRPSGLSL
jgi:hypothetical protein